MAEVVQLKGKPRPLRKTYEPKAPYVVERVDGDDGQIAYEVQDWRPDTYRKVCTTSDEFGENPYAKHDAEQIARALNLLVQFGKEDLPKVCKVEHDDDDDMED